VRKRGQLTHENNNELMLFATETDITRVKERRHTLSSAKSVTALASSSGSGRKSSKAKSGAISPKISPKGESPVIARTEVRVKSSEKEKRKSSHKSLVNLNGLPGGASEAKLSPSSEEREEKARRSNRLSSVV